MLIRWAHIASAVVLVGGVIYARVVEAPVLGQYEGSERFAHFERLAVRYRPLVLAAIAGLIISGLYNLLIHRGHTRYYHMWLGLKILLALHVFALALLAARSGATPEQEARRLRRMTGAIICGVIVILIAAFLRVIY